MENLLKALAAAMLILAAATSSTRAQNKPEPGASNGITAEARLPDDGNTGAKAGLTNHPGARSGDPKSVDVRMPRTSSGSWLLVPFGFCIVPAVILAVVFQFKYRRTKLMHETLRAMLEKGVPMTPELIASLRPPNEAGGHAKCYFLAGLILSAVGIGVIINKGKPGLIPLLLGAAFLIAWLVEKRNADTDQPPGP